MALKISHSSLRLPIRSGTKNIKSSNFPSKCSTNRLILPVRIRGKSWFSKCLLFGQYKRNSIWACAKLEFAGSEPVLDKARLEACPKLEVARVLNFGSTCYKFARPYAMLQVIVSSISFIARILVENKQLFKWSLLLKAIPCLTAMILGHAYSNGLNQIFDADIDRVNKPYLPISAGDLSIKQAWFLVIFYALAGQLILRLMNADLIITCLYCSALLLTTMYSAPPFRFKESSVTTIIMIPLSTIINNGVIIYATISSLGLPFRLSPAVVFILIFDILFFVATCLIKDIEDIEGDMKHNVRTFAARFGAKNMTLLGMGILLVNYIGAILVAIYMPQVFKRHLMLITHTIFTLWLLFQVRKMDKANYVKEASANFYQFLWRLLTLEFFLFPFI